MNPRGTLNSTFWAMVLIQTIGSLDLPGAPSKGSPLGGKGTRKMPSPRSYVAIFVLWIILDLFAETGDRQGRMAANFSLLVLLAGAVLGPFGPRFVSFLNRVASEFAIAPASSSASFSPTAPEGGITV